MKRQSGEDGGRIQTPSSEVTPYLHKLNLNILSYSLIYTRIISIDSLYSQLLEGFNTPVLQLVRQ